MPPARPKKDIRPPFGVRLRVRLRSLVPSRAATAYLFVGSMPVLVGVGVAVELGGGWGLVAGGIGAFGVGWLLGAD